MSALQDKVIQYLFAGIGALFTVLFTVLAWIATTQLADLKAGQDRNASAQIEIKNIATNSDKAIAVVASKVDDLKATATDLQGRVQHLEQSAPR